MSYAQGTPANLTFWLVAVGLWFAFGPELAHATFIPGWASSNAWNFPLNTGTSCMELFIGFLVSASTNRSERTLSRILAHQTQVGDDDLAADQDSRQQIAELRSDFAALQAQHSELGVKLDRLVALLETPGGSTPGATISD